VNVYYKKKFHYQSLISIGGWGWSQCFSDTALTDKSRKVFAESVADFVVKYQFDGADINWEYPTSESGPGTVFRPEDKTNYTLMIKTVREALDRKQMKTGKKYLLTVSTAGALKRIDEIEPLSLSKYADYLLIMSYEFRGQWDPVTGHNASLYANPMDRISNTSPDYRRTRVNVHDGIRKYLSAGVPADKIVLGVPFYGRGYSGAALSNNGLFQPFTGIPAGTWDGTGVFSYPDCLAFPGREFWDDRSRASWKFDGKMFLSYESPRAIIGKIEYIKQHRLAGIMAWELSADSSNTLAGIVYDNINRVVH
jgi:chitinase